MTHTLDQIFLFVNVERLQLWSKPLLEYIKWRQLHSYLSLFSVDNSIFQFAIHGKTVDVITQNGLQ